MKHFVAIVILLLVAAPAAFGAIGDPARPSEAGQFGLFVAGGLNMPQGDSAEGTKTGAALGGGLTYTLTNRFVVGGEVLTNGVGLDDETQDFYGDDVDVSMSVLRYSGFATYTVSRPSLHTFFLKGTAGSYDARLKMSMAGQELSMSASEFGFGGGVGFQFNGKSGTALIVETLFHHVPGDEGDMNFVTATVGLHFTVN
jgi:opacity protein-like surface antigen